MSDQDTVLVVYPDAKCVPNDYKNHAEGLNFAIRHHGWMGLTSWVATEDEAWAKAAARVRGDRIAAAKAEEMVECPGCPEAGGQSIKHLPPPCRTSAELAATKAPEATHKCPICNVDCGCNCGEGNCEHDCGPDMSRLPEAKGWNPAAGSPSPKPEWSMERTAKLNESFIGEAEAVASPILDTQRQYQAEVDRLNLNLQKRKSAAGKKLIPCGAVLRFEEDPERICLRPLGHTEMHEGSGGISWHLVPVSPILPKESGDQREEGKPPIPERYTGLYNWPGSLSASEKKQILEELGAAEQEAVTQRNMADRLAESLAISDSKVGELEARLGAAGRERDIYKQSRSDLEKVYNLLFEQARENCDRMAELESKLSEARALLNPACESETLIGAIKNLQQAAQMDHENAELLESKLAAAEKERDGWKSTHKCLVDTFCRHDLEIKRKARVEALEEAALLDPWKEHLARNPLATVLSYPRQVIEVKNALIRALIAQEPPETEPK